MTKEQLWEAYVARNPSFAGDGNITLSAAGLRKLYEQTWESGFDAGFYPPKPNIRPSNGSTPSNPFGDIFK